MSSNDLNCASFIGRLGKDVETKYMPSGDAIASFSLAVGSAWKDKAGNKQEATEWVNVTAFGKLAEICSQYLAKGSQVYLSGRMKTDKYTDKNGVEKYSTKIIADRMQMLGGKGDSDKGDAEPEQRTERAKAPESNAGSGNGFDDTDENLIPF